MPGKYGLKKSFSICLYTYLLLNLHSIFTEMRKYAVRKYIIALLVSIISVMTKAQDGYTYEFLNIPVSARAAALGGENITTIEDDFTMASQNPALLPCVARKNVSLSYMYYIKGVNIGAASFSSFINERLGWAVNAQYMDYGKMTKADIFGNKEGEFGAKDMALSATFSYEFSDYWSGGVTGKMLYSKYDKYSSFGLGFDLGLNYYKEKSDFSFSIVARNLGAQLKYYTQNREKLPVNLLVGVSKRLAHAPLRVSVTMQELNNWKNSPISEINGKNDKFITKFINHFVFGIDFIPTENFYASLGYNCRIASDMKVNGSSRWAGFTAGAGIQIKKFKIGASYARYHVSASSFMVNLSMSL